METIYRARSSEQVQNSELENYKIGYEEATANFPINEIMLVQFKHKDLALVYL